MIKLIATDMDGTFLDAQHDYDRERLSALLDQFDERGILFVVASGRSLLTLENLFADFLDRIAIVAENGSVVSYKGQIIHETLMDASQYLEIAAQLDAMTDCQGYLLSGHSGAYAPLFAQKSYLDRVGQYYDNVIMQDLEQVTDEIFKLTATFSVDAVVERSQQLSHLLAGVRAVTTGNEGMDIILESVNKATGLSALCQHFGVKADAVMAFGDNGNDLEMLEFAGTAIATENARDEIKAVANEVIGHCKDRAVQNYLEEWVTANGF